MDVVNVGVIILNYLAYEATMQCIKCFQKLHTEQVHTEIVVIDNGSLNHSYEKLLMEFEKEQNIHIFRINQNLGFAKGNNYGYRRLLEFGKFDYIIFSNDDVMFESPDMYDWIINCDKKYAFGVLGPQIYSVGGKYQQNPLENFTTNRTEAKHVLLLYKKILWKLRIKKIFHIGKKKNDIFEKWDNQYYKTERVDMTLHGSFLIFAKRYFEEFAEPFEPETFLYMEEYLLKLRCNQAGLPMVFSPNYRVNHLQAQSSVMQSDEGISKMIRRQKNLIASLKIYIAKLKETENGKLQN